jgi:hypothetical protein
VYCELINVYQIHHQSSTASDKDYLKVEGGSIKPIRRTQGMKSDVNGGVRSVNDD